MSLNCLVFHTSGGFSSSPAAFLFLFIFLRTESSSSWVNGPSLMSNCLLIILVISSCVTFGGFPSRFSKYSFHSFILSCWFAAFNFALAVLFLLLTSFIVCQAILDCLSSSESVILSIWFCMYSVCSFKYMPVNWYCAFFSFRMEQILIAYGLPKETVAAITILYKNTKVKVRSPDGDTEYFDIVAGVLQGDTVGPYLFIICLDYMLRTSIDKIRENGFELTKKGSRRYPAKTITDVDYADDIVILANTPNQAETLLHSLERAAASMSMHTKLNICAIIKQAKFPH